MTFNPDILFFSDLHLEERRDFQTSTSGINTRFEEGLHIIDQINELSDSFPLLDLIIGLGDFFEKKEYLPSWMIKAARESVCDSNQIWLWLLGNHDFKLPDHSPLELVFEKEDNLLSGEELIFRRLRKNLIGFIPYRRNEEHFIENLKEANAGCDVICFHQNVPGAVYSSGSPVDGKDYSELLRDDVLYLCGHIHKPQKVNNVQILGSPYQVDFGEAGEKKYVWLFDSSSRKLKPVELDYPKFVNMEYESFLKKRGDKPYAKRHIENNYVKIRGEIGEDNWSSLDRNAIREEIKESGARGVIVDLQINRKRNRVFSTGVVSDEEMIREYSKNNSKDGGFPPEELADLGMEIHNE